MDRRSAGPVSAVSGLLPFGRHHLDRLRLGRRPPTSRRVQFRAGGGADPRSVRQGCVATLPGAGRCHGRACRRAHATRWPVFDRHGIELPGGIGGATLAVALAGTGPLAFFWRLLPVGLPGGALGGVNLASDSDAAFKRISTQQDHPSWLEVGLPPAQYTN